jgi:hypothetical protein
MRIPNLEQSPSFMQSIGLLVCGIVLGTALMTGIAQKSIQELQYDIARLKKDNKALTDQVDNYEKVKHRRNVISKTTVKWDPAQKDLGESALSELQDRIGGDLKVLVGNPVHADMYALYRELVDGKVYYDVNDKDFRVRLSMLSVIGNECVVFVRAEPFLPN